MNLPQRAAIGAVAVAGFIYVTNIEEFRGFGLQDEEIQAIIIGTTEGFIQAEKDVFDVEPDVIPDDNLVPNPDPKKCPCQGTGKIENGDGHVTPCPYHGLSASEESDIQLEEVCPCGCNKIGCTCSKGIMFRR
jgi:hypothetical protein